MDFLHRHHLMSVFNIIHNSIFFFLSFFLLIFVVLPSYAWNISYDLYRGASNKRSRSPWYSVTVFLSPRCVFSICRHPWTYANKAYEVWSLYRVNQSEVHILRMIITTNFLSRCKKIYMMMLPSRSIGFYTIAVYRSSITRTSWRNVSFDFMTFL
jgi:hypothetical protein